VTDFNYDFECYQAVYSIVNSIFSYFMGLAMYQGLRDTDRVWLRVTQKIFRIIEIPGPGLLERRTFTSIKKLSVKSAVTQDSPLLWNFPSWNFTQVTLNSTKLYWMDSILSKGKIRMYQVSTRKSLANPSLNRTSFGPILRENFTCFVWCGFVRFCWLLEWVQ